MLCPGKLFNRTGRNKSYFNNQLFYIQKELNETTFIFTQVKFSKKTPKGKKTLREEKSIHEYEIKS